jgi:transposase
MSYNYGMARRKFTLSKQDKQELVNAFLQNKDGATRTRIQAVRMYGAGYRFEEIQRLTGCSHTSLMEWCQTYRRQGVAHLKDKRVGGNRAKLTTKQREDLKDKLHQYTPGQVLGTEAATRDGQYWTVEDLYLVVKRWYAIEYGGRNSYTELLSQCGFSYQRPAKVFKSHNQSKIADFEEQVEKK